MLSGMMYIIGGLAIMTGGLFVFEGIPKILYWFRDWWVDNHR